MRIAAIASTGRKRVVTEMRLRTVSVLVFVVIAAVAMRPRASDSGALKVMTFNIQHGIDGSSKYNLQRAIDTIARVRPDLVGLQEVTRNHPYYNCDDQPAKIADGLKAATGRPWSVVYEQEWFTPNVECRDAGRGDGKETEGLAFLSPAPLGSSSMTPLPVSRIALTVKPPAFGGAAVTVTHLASGKTNGPARGKEVEALLKWTEKLGPSQIVLGDFNLKPEEPELQPMLTMFRDVWTAAKSAGSASGGEGTHGDKRIDFVFVKGDALALINAETVETAGWFGKAASDHRPLVAQFRAAHGVR
jgi:endonuclease/exonuclease/phosphatase family metal-dependent hydrolase